MSTLLMFPGQGSQFVGMGAELFKSDELAKEFYHYADAQMVEYHGDNISDGITNISFEGPENTLNDTRFTQPAILVHSMAAFEKFKKSAAMEAAEISYLAGHSLGEFSALYAAEVLSYQDVIKLVIKRSDLMSKSEAGAMSAVIGLNEANLMELISPIADVSIANYNAKEQLVITGTSSAIEEANKRIENYIYDTKIRARLIPLKVSGAFHSPLMSKASQEFNQAIDAVEFKDAKYPIIQNVNAKAATKADELKTNLKKQMTGAVQWVKTLELALKGEPPAVSKAFEIGPGKVLTGLIKKVDRRFPCESV
jgi:[acyl-carrier-protein] S-malonyltransferase